MMGQCSGLLEKKTLHLLSAEADEAQARPDDLSVQAADAEGISPTHVYVKRACVLTAHDIYLALPPADGLVDRNRLTTKEALSAIPLESITGVSYGGNLHLVDENELEDVSYILDVVTLHHRQANGKIQVSRQGSLFGWIQGKKTGIDNLHTDHEAVGRPSLRFHTRAPHAETHARTYARAHTGLDRSPLHHLPAYVYGCVCV